MDDLQSYIGKLKPSYLRSQIHPSFYEDSSGQHAVEFKLSYDGYHRRYILIYDKFNVRKKTIKYIMSRYMC